MELNEITVPRWEFGGAEVTPVSFERDSDCVVIASALMRPEFAREGAFAANLTLEPGGPSYPGTAFASSPSVIRMYGLKANAAAGDRDAVEMTNTLAAWAGKGWIGKGKDFIIWN